MKIKRVISRYISYGLMGFLLCFTLIQCQSREDTYREFIDDGETIYVGKADSIEVRAGKERLEISWLLLSDPKVSSYKLLWNNGNDSIVNSVVKTENVDTVRVMLTGMPEYVYNFDIYLLDDFGNSSVRASAIGRTYGEFYQSTLFNRLFTASKRISNGLEVTWSSPSDEFVSLKLEYLDNEGQIINKIIDRTVEKDTLLNIPVMGSFKYVSAFLPEPNALDTFYVEPTTVELTN